MISGAVTQQTAEQQFFIVSDCPLTQYALRVLLTREQAFVCAGASRSLAQATDILPYEFSGVLVVTSSNMNLNGIDQLVDLAARPNLNILVLAHSPSHQYPRYYKHIGVLGQLALHCGIEQLKEAVETVFAGGEFIDSSLLPLMSHGTPRERSLLAYHSLSSREHEVMGRVVHGKSIKEMSKELFLSPKTISTYRYRLFEKLGVRNDAELVRLAFLHGLVRED